MKDRVLKLVICMFALGVSALVTLAQNRQISHDFSAFDALDVNFDFDVRVVDSRKYSISLNVDDVLKDHVQTYVKNHTLYITVNEKTLPSDIKKLYKGRKSSRPLLEATVYTSEPLTSIKLAGTSNLSVNSDIECRDFRLELSDNANVSRLTVDASSATVTAAGKSHADLTLYADNVKVNATGNSVIELEQDSENLEIVTGGSCEVRLSGETLNASLTTSGSSRVTLDGKTGRLDVNGSGSSDVNAIDLKTSECSAKLSGSSKLYEAATEILHVDISGNSTLIFDGDPVIDIIGVKSSTLQRYSTSSSSSPSIFNRRR